ncbi:MAG TPA: hypothetical protein ENI54_05570 [bacterium]|nr:hypothetical protein [bacterium]
MKKGNITDKHCYEIEANKAFDEINPDYCGILIIPGEKAPAAIRKDEKALEIAKSFFEKEKPVAAICHVPQILVTARPA